MLDVPVISDVFVVHTDASGLVLGGVLNDIWNGEIAHPVLIVEWRKTRPAITSLFAVMTVYSFQQTRVYY